MRFAENLLKLPVFDNQNTRIGHLHDLGIQRLKGYPKVNCLALMIYELEYIADYKLLEPAHNIVLAVSWEEVAKITSDGIWLKRLWNETTHYAWSKEEVFLGRDLLNVQIVDSDGHRIQRVDDLILELKDNNLLLAGIYVGFGSRLDQLNLAKASQHLLKALGIKAHEHILPWTSVETFGSDYDEIRLNVGGKEKQ